MLQVWNDSDIVWQLMEIFAVSVRQHDWAPLFPSGSTGWTSKPFLTLCRDLSNLSEYLGSPAYFKRIRTISQTEMQRQQIVCCMWSCQADQRVRLKANMQMEIEWLHLERVMASLSSYSACFISELCLAKLGVLRWDGAKWDIKGWSMSLRFVFDLSFWYRYKSPIADWSKKPTLKAKSTFPSRYAQPKHLPYIQSKLY